MKVPARILKQALVRYSSVYTVLDVGARYLYYRVDGQRHVIARARDGGKVLDQSLGLGSRRRL